MIKTARLILRPWKKEDLEPFAQLNADPRVMEFFPKVLTREESDQLAAKIISKFEKNNWGLWAVEVPGVDSFIGFIGLAEVTFNASFTPAVEVGWRLAYPYWNQGFATEGAKEALRFGFETLGLDKIVSFTTLNNERSKKVMEKIGMHYSGTFEHPLLAENHPLRTHVLYTKVNSKFGF